jgi:type IV secretory pathway TrbD component
LAKAKADTENAPRRERIYSALWRVRLWLGCPIIPLAILGGASLFCVPLALHTGNLWWMLAGIAYLSIVIGVLRMLAKRDPDFFVVYWRFANLDFPFVRNWTPRYDRHFPAVGSVGSPLRAPRRHQR